MDDGIQIVRTLVIAEAEARLRLWSIYRNAFERLNERTPIHHGGFSVAQFEAIMQDEDVQKHLVFVDSELVGVALLTNALEKIPWVNAPYFERRYPNRYRDGRIFFLPAVVIDPQHQDLRRIGAKLLQQAVTALGEDAVLAVDYSETLRQSLPAFVSRGLGISFKEEVLDRLVYQIFYCQDPD
ncbi:hypothetical protein ACFLTM_00495 [Candidatus Bipolaricaulota bacterium]